MNISNQAATEVKTALEDFLDKKLAQANLIEDVIDRTKALEQIRTQYYLHFDITCRELGIELKKWDQLG